MRLIRPALLLTAACAGLALRGAAPFDENAINPAAGARLAAAPDPLPSSGERITPRVHAVKVISHQRGYYHGWATVTASRTGRLFLVYSGGRDYHVCPFGRLDLMVSDDGGESWSWPRTLVDSLSDDRDSGIVETKSGVLLASFYTSIAYQRHLNNPARLLAKVYGTELDAQLDRWRLAETGATQQERQSDVGRWLVRSTDGGRTWSARYAAPGYCPHGPIALQDGRVFYAAGDGKKSAAWSSSDDGLTWTHLADLPVRAGELHSVEAADGTLLVHVRDKRETPQGVVQDTLQTRSTDGGRTWSKALWLAAGYPSHLLRLRDGTLLATYGSRTPPLGIRAKASRDHGTSWSEEFLLTTDAPNWDLGYPSTVERADGQLVTIWYEAPADDRHAQLRQARWEMPLRPQGRGAKSEE